MQFVFAHNNINVMDLEKSVRFYEDALNLKVVKTRESDDGSFKLTFLQGEGAPHQLELTWLRDRTEPYNLGDNEFHMAFHADDMETSYARHKEMG